METDSRWWMVIFWAPIIINDHRNWHFMIVGLEAQDFLTATILGSQLLDCWTTVNVIIQYGWYMLMLAKPSRSSYELRLHTSTVTLEFVLIWIYQASMISHMESHWSIGFLWILHFARQQNRFTRDTCGRETNKSIRMIPADATPIWFY